MDLDKLEARVSDIEKAVQELLLEIRQLKQSDQITEAKILGQRETAKRMLAARDARDKMPPLGMSIKEMVEEGRRE